jgi:hypothetical protein
MAGFLAMIIPVDQGVPTHPIAPGGPPLGIWGGVAPPYVDIGGPGPQPPSGAHPSHPIWRPDLGFWGGRPPPYVDIGLPGSQPHPSHPIYFPPPGSQPPLGIWGGRPPLYVDIGGPAPQPHPEHPIVLPPDLPPTTPEGGKIEWRTAWTATTGWVVVGIPQEPHPTPSAAAKPK